MPRELVSRGLELRSIEKSKRQVSFVASTDAIDSYEDVVEQDWILDRYLSNPVVLFGHNSRDLPVGKAVEVQVVEPNGRKQLECTIEFASAAANPLAEQVWNSVNEGTLRAVSVGFQPGDVRYEKRNGLEVFVLSKNTLHEVSVVPIPANPEALAKMKAKAMAAATHDHSTEAAASSETTMLTEKEMQDRISRAEAEKNLAEKQLADAQKDVASLKASSAAYEGTVKALETERDAMKARAEKAEGSVIENEVDALVGKKIAPAEKETFIELRKSNPALFTKMVAARPEMTLLGGPVVGDSSKAAPSIIGGGISNGADLSTKIFGA